jgi:hypothetical protein
MDFESRRNDGDRRPRPGSVIAKRLRVAASSLGMLVVVAGCAQGAAVTAKIPLVPFGVGHSVFGHPTTRPGIGQPSPTSAGHTPTPGASRTPAPATDANALSPSKHSPSPSATPRPTPGPTPTPRPHSSATHVLVIMEENQGYQATLGSCSADPYLCGLGSSYASVVGWTGTGHPSEPNYLAITTGGMQGCTSDTCFKTLTVPSIGGQLSAAGVPWTAYMESMPSACFTGQWAPAGTSGSAALYGEKHDPFVAEGDVLNNGCTKHVLPYPGVSSMVTALTGAGAPDFVWITPNQQDDMHSNTVQAGDAWLKANLAPVLSSPWFTGFNSTVIVTMDEHSGDQTGGGGAIPLVVVSSNANGKGNVTSAGNHYGLLRSIEETYRLPLLGAAANPANGDLRSWFG